MPAAARRVGPCAERERSVAVCGGEAVAGRSSLPASSEASTAAVPAASVTAVIRTDLAASMMVRRGVAASVVVIMPVLYSLLMVIDGEDGDHGLADVDAGEAELGGVAAGARAVSGRGGDRGAEACGEDDRGQSKPYCGWGGAQLGPLGVQRVASVGPTVSGCTAERGVGAMISERWGARW